MSSPSRKSRVLVVEDEFLIAVAIQEMLEDLGCEVIGPIASLSKALEYCQTAEFDAAILNLILEGELAYEVADALARRGIPFGFASGVDSRLTADGWKDRPFLCKPYSSAGVRGFLLLVLPDHVSPTDGTIAVLDRYLRSAAIYPEGLRHRRPTESRSEPPPAQSGSRLSSLWNSLNRSLFGVRTSDYEKSSDERSRVSRLRSKLARSCFTTLSISNGPVKAPLHRMRRLIPLLFSTLSGCSIGLGSNEQQADSESSGRDQARHVRLRGALLQYKAAPIDTRLSQPARVQKIAVLALDRVHRTDNRPDLTLETHRASHTQVPL